MNLKQHILNIAFIILIVAIFAAIGLFAVKALTME